MFNTSSPKWGTKASLKPQFILCKIYHETFARFQRREDKEDFSSRKNWDDEVSERKICWEKQANRRENNWKATEVREVNRSMALACNFLS